ncbi:Hypothetical predicted protein [Lecanosticta acicola]|uniref:Uncharacterized protein n=1 Tax=Lecanosticta acicola TaxID=111012 RepID=A0AAI8YSK9_9PEZI|nr:Hypothetical predicted protein [Lecanosticta acicola]
MSQATNSQDDVHAITSDPLLSRYRIGCALMATLPRSLLERDPHGYGPWIRKLEAPRTDEKANLLGREVGDLTEVIWKKIRYMHENDVLGPNDGKRNGEEALKCSERMEVMMEIFLHDKNVCQALVECDEKKLEDFVARPSVEAAALGGAAKWDIPEEGPEGEKTEEEKTKKERMMEEEKVEEGMIEEGKK